MHLSYSIGYCFYWLVKEYWKEIILNEQVYESFIFTQTGFFDPVHIRFASIVWLKSIFIISVTLSTKHECHWIQSSITSLTALGRDKCIFFFPLFWWLKRCFYLNQDFPSPPLTVSFIECGACALIIKRSNQAKRERKRGLVETANKSIFVNKLSLNHATGFRMNSVDLCKIRNQK